MKKSGKIIILISIVIALIAIVFRTFIGNCFIFAKIYIKVQSTSINFDNLFFEETIEVKSTGNSSSKYYFKDGNLKHEFTFTYNDEFLKEFGNLEKQITKIYYTNENSEAEEISYNGSSFEEENELVSYEEIKKNIANDLKFFQLNLTTEQWKQLLLQKIEIEDNCYKIKIENGCTYINRDTALIEKHVSEESIISYKYSENTVKDDDIKKDYN